MRIGIASSAVQFAAVTNQALGLKAQKLWNHLEQNGLPKGDISGVGVGKTDNGRQAISVLVSTDAAKERVRNLLKDPQLPDDQELAFDKTPVEVRTAGVFVAH